MSSPRFVPKSYALNPKQFGSSESIRWRSVRTEGELDNLISAQVHHLVALRVRRVIVSSGSTIEATAAEHGMGDQLGRLLRGDVVMRLEHIAWADRTFKLGVLAALFPKDA